MDRQATLNEALTMLHENTSNHPTSNDQGAPNGIKKLGITILIIVLLLFEMITYWILDWFLNTGTEDVQ